MEKTFGFIGTGHMGGALAAAVCRGVSPQDVVLCNRTPAKAAALAETLGCRTGSASEAAGCDYLFLGVKPQQMAALLAALRPLLRDRPNTVLISMAAGLTLHRLEELAGLPFPVAVLRIMPNLPVSVGRGVVLYDKNAALSDADEAVLRMAMAPAGLVEPLEERLMDAGSALCGCSPAFTALYLEALADGAVACGIPRAVALRLAVQATEGSAALLTESGLHPAALKDAVCSPGGSTIQGVRALEAGGFRAAVIEAVITARDANLALGT